MKTSFIIHVATMKGIAGVLSVLVIIAALVYRRWVVVETERMTAVLNGLLKAEQEAALANQLRVAVGFGSCVDMIGPGLDILGRIGVLPPDKPKHYDSLQDMNELQQIFAYFFRHGAAAERYMSNASLFNRVTEIASTVPGTKLAVGGNAPVMVNCILREGVRVLLGAQMTENLRMLISPDVEVAGDKVEEDDIHLIMEYKKGERWGKYEAPRSNRFIIHNDDNNPVLSSLEKFGSALKSFSPHLIIVSGLQMLDNFPFEPGQRRQRLELLASILSDVPLNTHVHFEMASFIQVACLQEIVDTVVRYCDSVGMNEQELPNLLSILTSGSITAISDAYPRVATTLDQMREVYRLLRRMTEGVTGMRRITRLHVHTVAFQAVLVTENSGGSPSWKNSGSAAARASLAASRHTCGDNDVAISRSRLLLDDSFSSSIVHGSRRVALEPEQPVTCWNEMMDDHAKIQICLAPVLVCTNVVQTVGGGDNVSSAGLLIQL